MSSIVVNGDTSGSVTLSAPATAGTVTVTLPSASGTMAVSGGSTSFTNLAYTGTLTGGTGVVNLGSGQVYKDASGNVGIGTSSPASFAGTVKTVIGGGSGNPILTLYGGNATYSGIYFADGVTGNEQYRGFFEYNHATDSLGIGTTGSVKATILSNGNMLVGKTTSNYSAAGTELYANGEVNFVKSSGSVVYVNRLTNDGILVELAQDGVTEGNISVSGTTVSYNGGHLSRWAQTTAPKDESLVKGTVLSNLDEMNVYADVDGNPVDNEQLNKVKVSDTEGDANVAGVFVNWDHDEAHNVDEINMAMTGDMIIRIAQGTTVARGDLLMSAGDGTAKPQGDDIVRSKTVAKVTSTHVTCTYADGSFCVPCVLMAC